MVQQHFGKEYSSNASENYQRYFVPAIGAPVANDLMNYAKLQPGEKVLDVACGTGVVTRMALELVGPSGSVTGLDINPGMLSVARKVSPSAIEWIESSAESIPLEDHTFDVVLCQISLQFVPDKLKALKEIHRILVPGGRVVFNVPGPLSSIYMAFSETLNQYVGLEAAGFVNKVFSLNNTDEIQQLMVNAGFNNVSVSTKEKVFNLPAPKDFLWQYINSTPLVAIVSKVDESKLSLFENEILNKWHNFEKNGRLIDRLNITTAIASK